VITKNSLILKI